MFSLYFGLDHFSIVPYSLGICDYSGQLQVKLFLHFNFVLSVGS